MDLVTVDVSFISLKHILPVIPPLLTSAASVIALVKPQFEAGRGKSAKGASCATPHPGPRDRGHGPRGAFSRIERVSVDPSPIEGTEGDREFLMLLR